MKHFKQIQLLLSTIRYFFFFVKLLFIENIRLEIYTTTSIRGGTNHQMVGQYQQQLSELKSIEMNEN